MLFKINQEKTKTDNLDNRIHGFKRERVMRYFMQRKLTAE